MQDIIARNAKTYTKRRTKTLCQKVLNNYALWGLIFVALTLPVLGDWQEFNNCEFNTPCEIYERFEPATGANSSCNITVLYNKTLLFERIMNATGIDFQYNFTFNGSRTGIYPTTTSCLTTGAGAVSQTIDRTLVVEHTISMGWQTAMVLLFVGLSALFIVIAFYYHNKKGMIPVIFRDGAIIMSMLSMLLGINTLNQAISFLNTAGNANLTNIGSLLSTAHIVLLVIIFITIIFSLVDFTIKAVQALNPETQRNDEEP